MSNNTNHFATVPILSHRTGNQFYLLIFKNYLFLAVLGSNCYCFMQAFSCCSERGLLFVVVLRLLIVVSSLLVAPWLQGMSSVVVAYQFSCSMACGIFPDQVSNLCPLHWQADQVPPGKSTVANLGTQIHYLQKSLNSPRVSMRQVWLVLNPIEHSPQIRPLHWSLTFGSGVQPWPNQLRSG